MEQTSTSKLVNKRIIKQHTVQIERIALKLNRLKDKGVKYKSYQDFLTQCIIEELVSKGLKFELETIISSYGQELVDKWYSKLKNSI